MLISLFKRSKKAQDPAEELKLKQQSEKEKAHVAARKGEIGEYKINIQLDQLPAKYKYLSDIMIENEKSPSGYSQIDHVIITTYGMFVIETKNYQGTIYGGRNRKQWSVNGAFKMMNPFHQNYGHIEALKRLLNKRYHKDFVSVVSFTKRCTFKIDVEMRKINSNELIVYDVELSEFIHRKISMLELIHRNPLLQEEEISSIHSIIQGANITDKNLRHLHVNGVNKEKGQSAIASEHRCITCNKPVSDKVAAYCLGNKQFKEKIYCFQHQHNLI
ncbi:NERD domain-containing protein [Virgibacillus flavescens]|uniref:NERD domain-containing protein n=1 Tax=Virgibacillus flavescens TaxID=1611422 RepID=UPI003D32FFA1